MASTRVDPGAAARAALAAVAIILASAGTSRADTPLEAFRKDWDAAAKLAKDADRHPAQVVALGKLAKATTVEAAQAALRIALEPSPHWTVPDAAMQALASLEGDAVRTWIAAEARGSDSGARRALLLAVVATWPVAVAKATLVPALRDGDPAAVAAAVDGLARIREKETVATLIRALREARLPRTRDDVVLALFRLTGKPFHDPVEWETWWTAEHATFELERVDPGPREQPELSVPRTTSDGTGLYERITSERVIFVIDLSRSMTAEGPVHAADGKVAKDRPVLSRLAYVRRELVAAIEAQLGPAVRFNVIAFGTTVHPWKPQLVEATPDNKKAVTAWLAGLEVEDDTSSYDALAAAFTDRAADTIYFLSDGFPTRGLYTHADSILGEVRKWNVTRKVRLHTIAYLVGDASTRTYHEDKRVARDFMRRLAAESGGRFRRFD